MTYDNKLEIIKTFINISKLYDDMYVSYNDYVLSIDCINFPVNNTTLDMICRLTNNKERKSLLLVIKGEDDIYYVSDDYSYGGSIKDMLIADAENVFDYFARDCQYGIKNIINKKLLPLINPMNKKCICGDSHCEKCFPNNLGL